MMFMILELQGFVCVRLFVCLFLVGPSWDLYVCPKNDGRGEDKESNRTRRIRGSGEIWLAKSMHMVLKMMNKISTEKWFAIWMLNKTKKWILLFWLFPQKVKFGPLGLSESKLAIKEHTGAGSRPPWTYIALFSDRSQITGTGDIYPKRCCLYMGYVLQAWLLCLPSREKCLVSQRLVSGLGDTLGDPTHSEADGGKNCGRG